MKFEVETTSVADRFTFTVASPQRGGRSVTVGARQSHPSPGRLQRQYQHQSTIFDIKSTKFDNNNNNKKNPKKTQQKQKTKTTKNKQMKQQQQKNKTHLT